MPIIFSTLLLSLGRDGEVPDTEDFVWEAAGFLTMGIPFLRDAMNIAETKMTGKGFGRSMGGSVGFIGIESGIGALSSGTKYIMEGKDKDLSRFWKEMTYSVGFALGVGTPQLWRTAAGSEAFFADDKGGPLAPLLGKPQQDKK